MSIGPQDNIAAATAVTAIRSPFRNEFLAPETDTSASALSGLRKNFDAIDKHNAGNCHLERILSSQAPSEGPCNSSRHPRFHRSSTLLPSSRAKRGTPQLLRPSHNQGN